MNQTKQNYVRTCLTGIIIFVLGFFGVRSTALADPQVIQPFTGYLDDTTFDPSVVKPGVTPLVMLSVNDSSGPVESYQLIELSYYAIPDIVIYSDGTVWYNVDSVVRASRSAYSLNPGNFAATTGNVHENYLPWKTVLLDPKSLSALLDAIGYENLPAYKSRHFNYGHAPHRLLTYWSKGKVSTITVGGPLYAVDRSVGLLPEAGVHINAAEIPAVQVARARASDPEAILKAIDALSSFDSPSARIVPPDNYHVILTPLAPGDSASAQPWPDTEVQFDQKAMQQNLGKDGEFDAEIEHDAYQAISAQLRQNAASDVYLISGKAFHVHLNSSFEPRGWKLIDAGLAERY